MEEQIQTDLSLSRPTNGKVTTIIAVNNWNGFEVDASTDLVVLVSESEGNVGDGVNTCTLQQKGDNYNQVEEEKKPKILTFKVDGVNYQFLEGMTWGEWVNSKYNTSDFYAKDIEYGAGIYDPIFSKVSYYTASNPMVELCKDICSKEPYYIFKDSNGNLTYVEI